MRSSSGGYVNRYQNCIIFYMENQSEDNKAAMLIIFCVMNHNVWIR